MPAKPLIVLLAVIASAPSAYVPWVAGQAALPGDAYGWKNLSLLVPMSKSYFGHQ